VCLHSWSCLQTVVGEFPHSTVEISDASIGLVLIALQLVLGLDQAGKGRDQCLHPNGARVRLGRRSGTGRVGLLGSAN
jgi:hypothetical protein